MKRVGIIGGGAVGLLLAGYLCRANFDVTVYTNTKEQADQLNVLGLTLRSNFIDYHLPVKSEPFADLNQLSADYLFIAVKQYHLKQLVPKLLLLPGNINSIIFMQNGMGHLSELEKFREKVDNLLVAIVEHGAMKEAQTSVSHTGVGEMKIGFYQKGEFSQIIWDKLNAVDFQSLFIKVG
ncbi:hypothetical protein H1D32_15805 [Anaerobacillus sp. CMMVII]|uniref:2-dehydropantoate 2-reductase N-terminal domain-containing protein n=1 Tax=Anaerobacillus sp. CMMVII TaxID=2755588 RepID=UPI0021B77D15|nr:2-dehydropantoate 2-reductase N-terminal domain-containing protein [Anaerobacillus sp. CMMVII]MCT8139035.1 hypothetical protein [Anaerobacillus sp. CMMVII]